MAATETMQLFEIVFKRNNSDDVLSAVVFYTQALANTRAYEAYTNPSSTLIFDSAEIRPLTVNLLPGEKAQMMEQGGWIAKSDIEALLERTDRD